MEPISLSEGTTTHSLATFGAWVVGGGEDALLRVWDTASLPSSPQPAQSTVDGHTAPIRAVDTFLVAGDGFGIASAASDGTVRLTSMRWRGDAFVASTIAVLEGHSDPRVAAVAAHATAGDVVHVVSGGFDKSVRLHTVFHDGSGATGVRVGAPRVLKAHTDWVLAVAMTSSAGGGLQHAELKEAPSDDVDDDDRRQQRGLRVVSASRDKTLRLWDMGATEGAPPTAVLRGHARAVMAVATFFSRRGEARIASGSADTTVHVWSGELRADKRAATGSDEAAEAGQEEEDDDDDDDVIEDRKPLAVLRGHTAIVNAVAACEAPGGPSCLASGSDDGSVRLWGLEAMRPLAVLDHTGAAVWGVAVAVARSGACRLVSSAEDATLRVWDIGASLAEGGGQRQQHQPLPPALGGAEPRHATSAAAAAATVTPPTHLHPSGTSNDRMTAGGAGGAGGSHDGQGDGGGKPAAAGSAWGSAASVGSATTSPSTTAEMFAAALAALHQAKAAAEAETERSERQVRRAAAEAAEARAAAGQWAARAEAEARERAARAEVLVQEARAAQAAVEAAAAQRVEAALAAAEEARAEAAEADASRREAGDAVELARAQAEAARRACAVSDEALAQARGEPEHLERLSLEQLEELEHAAKEAAARISEAADERRREQRMCAVCFEAPKNTALVPCGHSLCERCAERVDKCPTCRVVVSQRLRTF